MTARLYGPRRRPRHTLRFSYACLAVALSCSSSGPPARTTVIATLAEPLAVFPKLLAMPVAAVVPDHPPANFGEHPVGTGPWRLVEWKHDDYLLFARNKDYFDGSPKSDSLRARIIGEPSTA